MKTRIVEVSNGFVPQVNAGSCESTWWFNSSRADRWVGIDYSLFIWETPKYQLQYAVQPTKAKAQEILDKYLVQMADERKVANDADKLRQS